MYVNFGVDTYQSEPGQLARAPIRHIEVCAWPLLDLVNIFVGNFTCSRYDDFGRFVVDDMHRHDHLNVREVVMRHAIPKIPMQNQNWISISEHLPSQAR